MRERAHEGRAREVLKAKRPVALFFGGARNQSFRKKLLMLKLLDNPTDPQADDLRAALELLRRWTAAKGRLARVALYDRATKDPTR